MTTSKLWELSQDIEALENRISEIQECDELTEGERGQQIEAAFTKWLEASGKFEDKAIAVAGYIRYLESLSEARKQEYRRLRDLATQAQNQADKLRGYLIDHMTKANKTKIEGTTAKLSLRRKPPRVCLNCEVEALPDQFKKVEVTPRLTEIKKAIKDNPDIDWAFLSDSDEYSLTIR
ncbi:siphovirus Gp157 family protein [Crocosphaera sp. UHCC 0190]|uniref:siphovirus Gp157 family protein n=1 Tax=Crocosphaera sp. UHCC 0190 TaxID=3110246 RepID=UPI002B1ED58B|nr:siphovirus Gp157 family protein [Crocosphaera sp. UHCC 0190]MEA5511979.1 siphovirus Gp157 family protein [Crocosphaera sp. UHCC 0190]